MSKFIYFWIPTSINTIAIYALQLYGFKWAWEKKKPPFDKQKTKLTNEKTKLPNKKKRTSVETFWIFSVFKSRIKCKRGKNTKRKIIQRNKRNWAKKNEYESRKKRSNIWTMVLLLSTTNHLNFFSFGAKSVNEIKIEIVQHFGFAFWKKLVLCCCCQMGFPSLSNYVNWITWWKNHSFNKIAKMKSLKFISGWFSSIEIGMKHDKIMPTKQYIHCIFVHMGHILNEIFGINFH